MSAVNIFFEALCEVDDNRLKSLLSVSLEARQPYVISRF